jgi:uncharacterized membrane protein YcaP (DUF421 family)
MYWFLFLLFRFVLRRDVGSLGIADILLLVIVADAAQNAISGEYKTVSEGMIVVGTIVGWNLLLDGLAYRFALVDRFATPRSLPIVRHGRSLRANMARQLITPEELMTKLREQGIEHLSQVRSARLEPDGQISVIRYGKR